MIIIRHAYLLVLLLIMSATTTNALPPKSYKIFSRKKPTHKQAPIIKPIITRHDDPLFFAAQNNDVEKIGQLLDERKDAENAKEIIERVNRITDGNCGAGFLEEADELYKLLTSLRPINIQNRQRFTAVMVATYYGSYDALHLLIERGADIEATNYNGDTALHIAAACGDSIAAFILINVGGAAIWATNHQNKTPTEIAQKYGHGNNTELIELLDIGRIQVVIEEESPQG